MLHITIEIAGTRYSIDINREDEELIRAAAVQINKKIIQYQQYFSGEKKDIKDLLAMVLIQLSFENLKLERLKDTSEISDKMQQLTDDIKSFLDNNE